MNRGRDWVNHGDRATTEPRKHGEKLEARNSVVPWLRGQVTVEYFVLFAIVGLLTLIGFTRFDDDIKASLQSFVQAAAAKLAQ